MDTVSPPCFLLGHGLEISRNAVAALRAAGADAALARLALIVRGADTGRHDLAPECAGRLAVSLGLGHLHRDDHALHEKGFEVYDALYAACRPKTDGRAPPRKASGPS